MATTTRLRNFLANLQLIELEPRITPVLGAYSLAPVTGFGTGYDGVVGIEGCSGALLHTGRHILTAAHCVDADGDGRPDSGVTVRFETVSGRVSIYVPPTNIAIHPGWNGNSYNGADIAVLTLPYLAPHDADRYSIWRAEYGSELGQRMAIVGYGNAGTGLTGEIANPGYARRIGYNSYDAPGEAVVFPGGQRTPLGQVLLYDFDSGQPGQDALGQMLGVGNRGFSDEGSGAHGDSGSPIFIERGGVRYIAGVTSFVATPQSPPNLYVLNPNVEGGFGTIGGDMRVAAFAGFIDHITSGSYTLSIDLRAQAGGNNRRVDELLVRVVGHDLVVTLGNVQLHRDRLANIRSLWLVGSADGDYLRLAASVPASLPVVTRHLAVNDERIGTPAIVDHSAVQPLSPSLAVGTDTSGQRTPPQFIAVGAGRDQLPIVQLRDARTGNLITQTQVYESAFRGGVRVAVGDVNADLIEDLVVAPGPGGGPVIKVVDGRTGQIVQSFFAYESSFMGGAYVATGDVNGDGFVDIIVGAGEGGGPRVMVFSGRDGTLLYNFFAYDESFRGGVQVASADVDGDGFADIIVGAGLGGGPHVMIFSGRDGSLLLTFFAYDESFRGGVQVAAGDLLGTGRPQLIVGSGWGGGPVVRIFDPRSGTLLQDQMVDDPASRNGINVGIADATGSGLASLFTSAGVGGSSRVRWFADRSFTPLGEFFAFNNSIMGGVFVGGHG
jgi:hypothetical protein